MLVSSMLTKRSAVVDPIREIALRSCRKLSDETVDPPRQNP